MSTTNFPSTFKAARIHEVGGKFQLDDVPFNSQPTEGQVIVKVLASGVCHTDAAAVYDVLGSSAHYPLTPGHEIAGKVVLVGPGEKRWKVGDYVGAGFHGGHCHVCDACRRGNFINCETKYINGILSDGGHAEYVTLRTESIVSLPDDLDPVAAAPLLCAGVTTFNSLRSLHLSPGSLVAVHGIGGLGHLAIQFARASGYRVVALSTSASKAKLAKELGAHIYIDGSQENQTEALKKLGGAKAILATAPHAESISALIPALAVDGTLLLLAAPSSNLDVSGGPMIFSQTAVKGWNTGRPADEEDTVQFAVQAGIKPMTETFPLERVQEAFDMMMANQVRFRAVLTFE
ncbi:hypothetical protein JCM10207_008326 [Rhodosporidiobolus poonsookiae]